MSIKQEFKTKDELDYIEVSNDVSEIKIALQGAHIFDFQLKGKAPLLFLSDTSHFKVRESHQGWGAYLLALVWRTCFRHFFA